MSGLAGVRATRDISAGVHAGDPGASGGIGGDAAVVGQVELAVRELGVRDRPDSDEDEVAGAARAVVEDDRTRSSLRAALDGDHGAPEP